MTYTDEDFHSPAVVALLHFLADRGYTSADLLRDNAVFVPLCVSISNSIEVKQAAEAMLAEDMKR